MHPSAVRQQSPTYAAMVHFDDGLYPKSTGRYFNSIPKGGGIRAAVVVLETNRCRLGHFEKCSLMEKNGCLPPWRFIRKMEIH